jgi:hypothetical protein
MIEDGPQFVCRYGDEECAFTPGGACTNPDPYPRLKEAK